MRPWVSYGDARQPAAVIVHGTGSCPDFVHRCFTAPLSAVGLRLVTYPLRGHCGDLAPGDGQGLGIGRHVLDLAEVVTDCGARIVGGLSLGAHAAALWAGNLGPGDQPDGLLLCLPAWTGAPTEIAAANAIQADELDRIGLSATLARISASSVDWVTEEIAASWPMHDTSGFVAALRGIATSAAPSEAQLATVDCPVGVVGLLGDAWHPAAVAARWAATLPRATLGTLTVADWGAERSLVGATAVNALRAAGWVNESR